MLTSQFGFIFLTNLRIWLNFQLLEICIQETIKHMRHTPVHWHWWLDKRAVSKHDLAYYSSYVEVMGHMFSMIARVVPEASDGKQRFSSSSVNYVVEAHHDTVLRLEIS